MCSIYAVAQPEKPVSSVILGVTHWQWWWWCCLWADPPNPDRAAFISETQTHAVNPGGTMLLTSSLCTSQVTHSYLTGHSLHQTWANCLASFHLYLNPSRRATATLSYFSQKGGKVDFNLRCICSGGVNFNCAVKHNHVQKNHTSTRRT